MNLEFCEDVCTTFPNIPYDCDIIIKTILSHRSPLCIKRTS